MIRSPGEAVVSRERLGQQLLLACGAFVVVTATAVVVKEPGVVAFVSSRAADAVDEDVPIGCRRGRGRLFKILSVRSGDFLLLVAAETERVPCLGASAAIAKPCG